MFTAIGRAPSRAIHQPDIKAISAHGAQGPSVSLDLFCGHLVAMIIEVIAQQVS
jgi:hypothetical protein